MEIIVAQICTVVIESFLTCLDMKSTKCVTGAQLENSAVTLLLCGSMNDAFTTPSEDDSGADTVR
jgi:hypothetical protein